MIDIVNIPIRSPAEMITPRWAMTEKLIIILTILLLCAAFSQESERLVTEDRQSSEASKMSLQPASKGHESLLSPERLTQFRSLNLGYATDGRSSASGISYMHGFNYTISPKLKTSGTLELSRSQSKSGEVVELTPAMRLDWRPFEGGRVTLDLRMSPQRIQGTGLESDFKTNFLRR